MWIGALQPRPYLRPFQHGHETIHVKDYFRLRKECHILSIRLTVRCDTFSPSNRSAAARRRPMTLNFSEDTRMRHPESTSFLSPRTRSLALVLALLVSSVASAARAVLGGGLCHA